ncbi:DUF6177 family protein [Streptomyces sp. WM6378]|uniref:DUF6177 family protein n=1 Tax=Streptomyces sp. WM6378 TaxID=1415557 RepID=UPI001F163EBE|nr:DUF6177 family protein [Streptomyces sp. WM6378]
MTFSGACQLLTGAAPAGWSTAEPLNLPWSRRELTPLTRDGSRNSGPTWIVAIGAHDRPATVTIRIAHTRAGVEEHITLAVGHPDGGRARVPSSYPGAGSRRCARCTANARSCCRWASTSGSAPA